MKNFFVLLAVIMISCSSGEEKKLPFIRGVYGNPGALLDAGYRYDSLGMNSVFVRSVSFNREFYENAREQGMKIFVEFPTLLGRDYLSSHPEAWPVNEKGEQAPPASWFMGICPTDQDFWDYRVGQLEDILRDFDVDGIFLDYVHWHAQFETSDPILPETCFCDGCTGLFSKDKELDVQGGDIPEKATWIMENADREWRDWRNSILNGWVSGMGEIVKDMRPEALLGIFYCSWYPEEHDSALYRTLGIDVAAFARLADVLSPMLFHKMKEKEPSWAGEYIRWLDEHTGAGTKGKPLIWPIVQSHNNPQVVSPEEFREVMLEGSVYPGSGIMMFSDRSLLEDPGKIEVMKDLYLNHPGFR